MMNINFIQEVLPDEEDMLWEDRMGGCKTGGAMFHPLQEDGSSSGVIVAKVSGKKLFSLCEDGGSSVHLSQRCER